MDKGAQTTLKPLIPNPKAYELRSLSYIRVSLSPIAAECLLYNFWSSLSSEALSERLFGGRAEVGGAPMYSTKQAQCLAFDFGGLGLGF